MMVHSDIAESRYSKTNIINEFPTIKYEVNCSGFINYALNTQYPKAIQEIKNFIKSTEDNGSPEVTPWCLHYFKFFQDKKNKEFWEYIDDANNLEPGDIIVFCENTEKITKSGQHIMLLASAPQCTGNGWNTCNIYDSTGNGHDFDDPRGRNNISGIGEGKIALQVNSDGTIGSIKWSPTSKMPINATVAIGRIKCKI
jgi:hypothetical protein